jgi:hypothetical protein
MIRYCLIIIILLLALTHVHEGAAQRENAFSGNDSLFLEEIEALFGRSRPDALKRFEDVWESGRFSKPQQERIAQLARQFYGQRMRATNGFEVYLECLNRLADSTSAQGDFEAWAQVLAAMEGERVNQITAFLRFCKPFFEDGSLYSSRGRGWKVSNGQGTMVYQNGTAVLRFEGVDLLGFGDEDTIDIARTSGRFRPESDTWKGRNGRCDWSRFGIAESQIYVDLNRYQVDVRTSSIEADSVRFMHTRYLDQPILGDFEDRIQGRGANYQRIDFPRFRSYRTDFRIDDFAEDVRYVGGLGMQGMRILGNGRGRSEARMDFLRDNRPKLRIRSHAFTIDSQKFIAPSVQATLFLGQNDSLYHPNLYMNFNRGNRKLRLSKSESPTADAPFYDSYHQTEIDVNVLEWYLDSADVTLSTGIGKQVSAVFHSAQYFSEEAYREAEGVLSVNPLSKLAQAADRFGRSNIPLQAIAQSWGVSEGERILGTILSLHDRGFLIYDERNEEVSLNPKLFHFVRAHFGTADYDAIRYISRVDKGPNARISLDSNHMEVKGVETIYISDSQQVYMRPKDQAFTLKKSHDITMDGRILSGRWAFNGTDFQFSYDKFKIDLNQANAERFFSPQDTIDGGDEDTSKASESGEDPMDYTKVEKFDQSGRKLLLEIYAEHEGEVPPELQGVIAKSKDPVQDINGYLYLEDPNNKSSRKANPEYPIISANEGGYFYFDKPFIFNGVYKRDSFYFKTKKFVIDSLDNSTVGGQSYDGVFKSGGIFPEIETSISQQGAYMAFEIETPEGGYPMYHGKATADMTLTLDGSEGFFGSGTMTYQGTKIRSDRFKLFPDSINARVQQFVIPKTLSEKYPTLEAENIDMHYRPYADSLTVYSEQRPFALYEDRVKVEGKLVLRPKELRGSGVFTYRNATARSEDFAFQPKHVRSDSANLDLATVEPAEKATAYKNPATSLDLDVYQERARGRSVTDTVVSSLPPFEYKTQIASYNWDAAQQKLRLQRPGSQSKDDAWMLSTREEADSLQFSASIARMDLASLDLQVDSVFFVSIGDAKIYPNNNEMEINEDGSIAPLQQAAIEAPADSPYHRIYDASVNIFSGKYFTGSGKMDYTNNAGRTFTIPVNEIATQDDLTTRALGYISDSLDFMIGKGFRYTGGYTMYSDQQALEYDGFVKPDHQYDALNTQAFQFRGALNSDSVSFDVSEVISKEKERLYSGIYYSEELNKPYMLLLGTKLSESDEPLIAANGRIEYQDALGEFVVNADSLPPKKERKKIDPRELRAMAQKQVRYRVEDSLFEAFGRMRLPYPIDNVDLRIAGTIRHSAQNPRFNMEAMVTADFPFSADAAQTMTDSVLAFSFYEPDIKPDNYHTRRTLPLFFDDTSTVNTALRTIAGSGQMLLDRDRDEMPLFWFSKVDLLWDPNTESFHTQQGMEVLNMRSTPVSKRLGGRMEYKLAPDGGGEFTLLFEPYPGGFFFFNYYNQVMRVQASDYNFTQEALDPRGSVLRGNYEIEQAGVSRIDLFQSKFKQQE